MSSKDKMTATEFRQKFVNKQSTGNGKAQKRAPELVKIEFWLKVKGVDFVTEYRFCPARRWKADIYLPKYSVLIEYEGLNSVFVDDMGNKSKGKSGHATLVGYSANCEKYNMACLMGFRLLRYTAINFEQFYRDFEKIEAKYRESGMTENTLNARIFP